MRRQLDLFAQTGRNTCFLRRCCHRTRTNIVGFLRYVILLFFTVAANLDVEDVLPDVGCLLALSGNHQYPPGTILDGNCMYDYELNIPIGAPHCPKSVPIAIILLPKAASTTLMNWLAVLDGTAKLQTGTDGQVHFVGKWFEIVNRLELIARELCVWHWKAGVCHRSEENTLKWAQIVTEGSLPRGVHFNMSSSGLQISADEFIYSVMRFVREGQLPHPHNCIACCYGRNRMPVIVLRNPYSRLLSYFQRAWVADSSRGSWSSAEFPIWVDAVHMLHATNAFDTLKLKTSAAFVAQGRQVVFNVEDLFHMVPASKLLETYFPSQLAEDLKLSCAVGGCWLHRSIAVVNIETLRDSFGLLNMRLCLRNGFCGNPVDGSLDIFLNAPRMDTENKGTMDDLQSDTLWKSEQGQQAARIIFDDYKIDFKLGNYAIDPKQSMPQLPSMEDVGEIVKSLTGLSVESIMA